MELKDIKKLGFGLMRLPSKDGHIDVEETGRMVDCFLKAGCNYFDTAWAYEGSEEAIRKALVERYPRESFWLTTKNAAWKPTVTTKEEAEYQLTESLERTGAGYFDLYLLHNMGSGREKAFDRYDMWEFLKEKKAEGVIRHTGFSAHCSPELIDELLTKHPEVEFVQLQINYADWNHPSVRSRACYETVLRHGKQVIIMEPVKGGILANPPEQVKSLLQEAEPDRSCASWALRFALSLPGVLTVLSGMSNMQQMEDNLATLNEFSGLTEKETEIIEQARTIIDSMPLVQCTACNYCASVCPKNIGISGAFLALNTERLYHNHAAAKGNAMFNILAQGKQLPKECIECGACEKVCPQKLEIRKLLKEFTETVPMD